MSEYPPFDDQMNSNSWNTKVDLHRLMKSLHNLGWTTCQSNNLDFAILKNNTKTLEINFTHVPKMQSDITITDNYNQSCYSLAPIVYGNYSVDFVYNNTMPNKKFNSFVGRGCPNRSSWFYWFVRKNWLNQANITYHCEDRYHQLNSNENDFFDFLFEYNEPFKSEHEYIKRHLNFPYVNFDMSIEQAIIDSEKTLILETFFEDWYKGVTFSEKTFRALQLPRPFLLFGHQGSVKLLRQWGFDVYDDYIDHSYDSESQWLTRQKLILSELEKPLHYSQQLLDEFEQRAKHNRKILHEYSMQWPDFFQNFLDQLNTL